MLVKIFNLIRDFLFPNTHEMNIIIQQDNFKNNPYLLNLEKSNYKITEEELGKVNDLIELMRRQEKISPLIYSHSKDLKDNNPLTHKINKPTKTTKDFPPSTLKLFI